MRTVKLTIQYDGTNYVGWQRQAAGTSIQALLEDALAPIEGQTVTVHGAGRTDAGAHALAQVASVSLTATIDGPRLVRALNAVLPEDVRVTAAEDMPTVFTPASVRRARRTSIESSTHRSSSPFLFKHTWHVPQPLDFDAMREAAAPLAGRHDFAAYQGDRSIVHSSERTIEPIRLGAGRGGPTARS